MCIYFNNLDVTFKLFTGFVDIHDNRVCRPYLQLRVKCIFSPQFLPLKTLKIKLGL